MVKPRLNVPLETPLTAVVAVGGWVGTACVLETASRRAGIGGKLRGLMNEAA